MVSEKPWRQGLRERSSQLEFTRATFSFRFPHSIAIGRIFPSAKRTYTLRKGSSMETSCMTAGAHESWPVPGSRISSRVLFQDALVAPATIPWRAQHFIVVKIARERNERKLAGFLGF